METGEEERPAGLSGVQPFRVSEVFQVPVISDDPERVNDVVVLLRQEKLAREIRTGREFMKLSEILGQYHTYTHSGGIDLYDEWSLRVWMGQGRSGANVFSQLVKAFSSFW